MAIAGKKDGLDFSLEYRVIIQNDVINTLTTVSKKSFKEVDTDGFGKVEKNELTITLQDFKDVKLDSITWNTLHILTSKLNENFSIFGEDIEQIGTICLTTKEYAEIRKIKSVSDARVQLIDSLKTLSRIRLSFLEPIYEEKRYGVKEYVGHDIPLVGDVMPLYDNKKILKDLKAFKFSSEFISFLIRKKNTLPVPVGFFAFNNKKNPNSFYLASKILEYSYINRKKRGDTIILGVRTLLKSTPELPLYEDIKKLGRIEQKIKQPFIRDLDNLVEKNLIENWEYCNAKGTPLTDKQIESTNFNNFQKLYVKIKL